VKSIFIRAVQSHLRRKAKRRGIIEGKPGAVVFVQPFGPTRFTHGFSNGCAATDPLPFGSPELGQCYAASVQGKIGLGEKKGADITRQGRMKEAKFMEFTGTRCTAYDGFTLHANVWIHGRRRTRLERLRRYVARGAIATARLSRLADGRVHYRLRKLFWDGTRAVIFESLTFIEKPAALIPPPRRNLVSYHGVFAPNSSLRQAVIPQAESNGLRPIQKRRCYKQDPVRTPYRFDSDSARNGDRLYIPGEFLSL